MPIQAYQFIRYDNHTSTEHIEKIRKTGCIICFDFEDGILDPLNQDNSTSLKEKSRKDFNRLYFSFFNAANPQGIGIRLNNNNPEEFEKDLNAIEGKSFDSVFLTKIEQAEDIENSINRLNLFKVGFKNVIPVIESKKGFENITGILSNGGFDKIAFGHCDYNLNLGIYPFFHQESREYWKWIDVLLSGIKKHGMGFINSPYLNIKNEDFYCSMLDYMEGKGNVICGQITLSTKQSELCISRNSSHDNLEKCLENKNRTSVEKEYALELIAEFEAGNKSRGLTKSKKGFISLQEYRASKKLLSDERDIKELCFVGGCFAVQHNIVYENLFHQKLKQKTEDKFNIRVNFNLLRYERFCSLLNKIEYISKQKQLDLIIFHIRPEPYLRLVKLYYKYINYKGRLKWSLNLPWLNLLKPEKFDLLTLNCNYNINTKKSESKFHGFLISLNYLLGKLTGNQRYALKNYQSITNQVIDLCERKKIKLLILGPNRRTNNYFEPSLCKDLDVYISERIKKHHYICGFEKNSDRMNQENGIHASQAYHDLIADNLFNAILEENLLKG